MTSFLLTSTMLCTMHMRLLPVYIQLLKLHFLIREVKDESKVLRENYSGWGNFNSNIIKGGFKLVSPCLHEEEIERIDQNAKRKE